MSSPSSKMETFCGCAWSGLVRKPTACQKKDSQTGFRTKLRPERNCAACPSPNTMGDTESPRSVAGISRSAFSSDVTSVAVRACPVTAERFSAATRAAAAWAAPTSIASNTKEPTDANNTGALPPVGLAAAVARVWGRRRFPVWTRQSAIVTVSSTSTRSTRTSIMLTRRSSLSQPPISNYTSTSNIQSRAEPAVGATKGWTWLILPHTRVLHWANTHASETAV